MPETIGNAPTAAEITVAVERMIASDVFSRSPQLGAFLRFVTDATLQGKSDRIKAYTIGLEVLRRDASFDPQIDPIVRVEATRLRRAIERYYAGPGQQDAIVVDLPRGSTPRSVTPLRASTPSTCRWPQRPLRLQTPRRPQRVAIMCCPARSNTRANRPPPGSR